MQQLNPSNILASNVPHLPTLTTQAFVDTPPEPSFHILVSAPSTSSQPPHSPDSHHSARPTYSSRLSKSSPRFVSATISPTHVRNDLGRLPEDEESRYRLGHSDTHWDATPRPKTACSVAQGDSLSGTSVRLETRRLRRACLQVLESTLPSITGHLRRLDPQ